MRSPRYIVRPGQRPKCKHTPPPKQEYSASELFIPDSMARKIAKRWQWWRTWLRFGPFAVTSETERAQLEPVHRDAMFCLLRAGFSVRDITRTQYDDPRLSPRYREALVELYLAARSRRARKKRRGRRLKADIALAD
jgi:hypothetical protein